jgi:putative copper resistance protein D
VLLTTLADQFATPVSSLLSVNVLLSFVTQIPQGTAWFIAMACALAVGPLLGGPFGQRGRFVALLLVLGALLPVISTGHASSAGDHDLAVSALTVHVVGSVLWAGGILACLMLARDQHALAFALSAFGPVAMIAATMTAVGGAAMSLLQLGDVGRLFGSPYGRIVVFKVLLLALAVGAGVAVRGRRQASPRRLLLAEGLLLAVAIGAGAALGRVPPGSSGAGEVAETLLGFPIPGEPSVLAIVTVWRLDLLVVGAVTLAAVAYATGYRRLRHRGVRWPLGRLVCAGFAFALAAFATVGGLGVYGQVAMSWHMVQHMTLAMVVPILVVLAAPITLVLRALPADASPGGRLRRGIIRGLHGRPAAWLTFPPVAWLLFVTAPFAVYFSGVLQTTMASHWGHLLLIAHFLIVGCVFFGVVIGVDPLPHRPPHLVRVVMLLSAMAAHAMFGLVVMTTGQLLADGWFATLAVPWIADPLANQQLAGGIVWGFGEIPGLLVMVVLVVQWIRSDARAARRQDRQEDRSGDASLAEYNAMLAARAGGRHDGAGR